MFGLRLNVWRIDQMQEVCVPCLRAKYMVFYHPPGPMSVDVGVEMEWDPQKSWIWGVPVYQSGALTTFIVQNEAYTSLEGAIL